MDKTRKKYWKNVSIGLILTILLTIVGSCNKADSYSYGFPIRFLTFHKIEYAHFYETINFDLAFFVVNILFWAILVHLFIKIYKRVLKKIKK